MERRREGEERERGREEEKGGREELRCTLDSPHYQFSFLFKGDVSHVGAKIKNSCKFGM